MKKAAFILIAGMVAMVSCSKDSGSSSGGGGGGTTTNCTGTKTWSSDVSPIITSTCAVATCHASGSTNGPGALTNYTQVFNARTSIRSAVASGTMPKTGNLSTTEKNNILCWIDNGAPNN